MNEIWNQYRINLEAAVVDAALNLFAHIGSGAFKLPIKNTMPEVFVVAGNCSAIQKLMQDDSVDSPTK